MQKGPITIGPFLLKKRKWGGRRDSNPRPSVPQTDALTN